MRTLRIIYLLLLAASQTIFAANSLSHSDTTWVATLSAGPEWSNGGHTQTLNLSPDVLKTYTNSNSAQTVAATDLFIGIQKSVIEHLQAQFGLDVATTDTLSLSGNIWDDADPAFNNYTYQYRINHTHINLKGKLLVDIGARIIPWVSASAGVGFNRASHFSNTPLIFEAIASPNFSSNTVSAFNYTLGIGLQTYINPHLQVGAGYEFADWGRSHLGNAAGQSSGGGLSLSHFYTSGLMFNLTYLA